MKILLDSCVWGKARGELESAGHDVVWTGDSPKDPGDEEILACARSEGRVLVTLDKDFCELAVLHGASHCGIVRLADISARQQAAVCQRVLGAHGPEPASGAIVTAEAGRLRIRLPCAAHGQRILFSPTRSWHEARKSDQFLAHAAKPPADGEPRPSLRVPRACATGQPS
jgi:predicted nuclease of predicted toxin-antitoxin system